MSDNFILKGPKELLWLVYVQRPKNGSLKLVPIKYENSFVLHHFKLDEVYCYNNDNLFCIMLKFNQDKEKKTIY